MCAAQVEALIKLYCESNHDYQKCCPLTFGTELIINPLYRQVFIDSTPIELTRTEFDLLFCLVKHPGQVWSRRQLYNYVWADDLGISGDNTVRAHIGNLHKKLADAGKKYIQNSSGVGYRFVPPVPNKKNRQKWVPQFADCGTHFLSKRLDNLAQILPIFCLKLAFSLL